MRGIATTLNNVLRLNFKSCWIVNLLEVTSEVSLVVVLPLYQATNLVSKLGIADVTTSLIHSTLVTAFESRTFCVIPQTTTLIASLMIDLASNDVEDKGVTGNLLVRLYLDNVSGLNTAPVSDLEALVSL